MHTTPKRVSAADIAVPMTAPIAPPAAAAGPVDVEAVLHDVWQLLGACGDANKNDRLAVAIEALIGAGVRDRARIVGAARALGFDPAHVGALLGRERHRWHRGGDGGYRLGAG